MEKVYRIYLSYIAALIVNYIVCRFIVALYQKRLDIVHSYLFGVILEIKNSCEIIGSAVIAVVIHLALRLKFAYLFADGSINNNYRQNYKQADGVYCQKRCTDSNQRNELAEISPNQDSRNGDNCKDYFSSVSAGRHNVNYILYAYYRNETCRQSVHNAPDALAYNESWRNAEKQFQKIKDV